MSRKALFFLLKFLVSVVLLYFLLSKIGVENFLDKISRANLWWVAVGICSFLVSDFLGSLQWYLLMRQSGMVISYRETVKIYFIGLFFNNFFISNLGGDVFRIYYASRATTKTAGAVSTVVLDRFIGFSMLTVLSLIGGLLILKENYLKTIIPVVIVTLFFWILLFTLFFNRSLAKKFHPFFVWLFPESIVRKFIDLYEVVHEFRHAKLLLLKLMGIGFFVQLFRIGIHYFAGLSLNTHIGFQFFMLFIPLIALLASLPISIGGLGVREQSGVVLFARVGIVAGLAAAMEFLAYLMTITGSLPGAVLFLLAGKKKGEKYES
ncbi:hypothetical protein BMS3Abin05_00666 [bacterium BMS3Abin05]|nr:hypothetical protein BMS3Abin05_00666 [bacterium BMS3Abin05]GBE26180.1 hypothetical protein BMS3Bbin03_00091 [bacterium BMS3Bbin03]